MGKGSRLSIHLCLVSVEVGYFWNTHTPILMSVACRLIEIWTWIIHGQLMSLGSLLTVNSRRVDLNVWCAVRVGLIAAEVRKAPHYACC